MIYEFKIKEIFQTIIPVKADSPDEAQKIFDKWYEKHDGSPADSTIQDLLDNGYDGREITRSVGIKEDEYDGDIMLPEEKPKPKEPVYDLYVRFADGTKQFIAHRITLAEYGGYLRDFGAKYHLFPDTKEPVIGILDPEDPAYKGAFSIYAVLKDKEETWYEME